MQKNSVNCEKHKKIVQFVGEKDYKKLIKRFSKVREIKKLLSKNDDEWLHGHFVSILAFSFVWIKNVTESRDGEPAAFSKFRTQDVTDSRERGSAALAGLFWT